MKLRDKARQFPRHGVAPLAGARIEIFLENANKEHIEVAPLAGAWIEIRIEVEYENSSRVAPLAGAWIEILMKMNGCRWGGSLPSRERELKHCEEYRGKK